MSVLLLTSAAEAEAACRTVSGRYTERDAGGAGCASPVGLCIAGEYRGDVRGAFDGAATALIPTADTTSSGVVLFTSDSTITAHIGNRSGTLVVKNAGASGAIRASGTFVDGAGTSEYTGTVCRPTT